MQNFRRGPPRRVARRLSGVGDLSDYLLQERDELDQPAPVIAPPSSGVIAPPQMSANTPTGLNIPQRVTLPQNCYYNASALSGDGVNSIFPILLQNPLRKSLQIQTNINYTLWVIFNQYAQGYDTAIPEQGALELQPSADYEPFICPINNITIFCINPVGPTPVAAGALICRFIEGM